MIEINIMEAPEGTCSWYDRISPPRQLTYPIAIDSQIIFLKLYVNRFAVICGNVSNDMARTIPIILRHATMVSAMNIISVYSNSDTGICCERANSLSNAIDTIGLRKMLKNKTKARLIIPSKIISPGVMVSIFPKRKEDSSGVNPGARKLNIIPTAIPNVQNTAIAESSLISLLLLNHSTPNADKIEKTAADSNGDMPEYKPIPIPPNDACVMPPLIKTNRRVTIYVPIIPHAILAKRLPSSAF